MARVLIYSPLLPLCLFALLWAAPASSAVSVEKQRQQYIEAMNLLGKGHDRAFMQLKSKLRDYPLYPYLEYEYLRKHISSVPQKEILSFLNTYDNSPVADRLRYTWLRYLARKKDWKNFVDNYRSGGGTSLRCYYAGALFKVGRDEEAMEEARSLWLVGKSQSQLCNSAFKTWQEKGGMTRETIWQRIELAMEHGRLSLAEFLEKELQHKEDKLWVQRWLRMYRKPAETLHLGIYQQDTAIARKIVRSGVRRLARRDVEAAMNAWQRVRDKHRVSEAEEAQNLDQYLALRGALVNAPDALNWLAELSQASDEVKEWRIRTALKQQNWPAALTWIESLPSEKRNIEDWQYWRARILEMQSSRLPVLRTAAERIYADLAKQRSYHGFLAADRMGVPYSMTSEPLNFDQQELVLLEQQDNILRARELYKIDRLVEARREWFYAIADFNEVELRRAAVLADSWGWHDRAIATVAKAEHFDDIELRFPMAFRDQVVNSATEQELDPAWVYGVLRQESGFMTDARSASGALGLMQLMPRTGRLAARELKTRVRSNYEILDVTKNIRLGAAYLQRMLQKSSGNSALATASYNAGPYRVAQWVPTVPTAADLWVESIPYGETREYVKRVMAYTVIYDYRLDGQAEQLRNRMPMVQPTGG